MTSEPSPRADLLRNAALQLFLASFVVLFQELTLIRWLAGKVRVVAYFPNLVLISAFLGLGLGALRAGHRRLMWLWPVALAVLCGTAVAMSHIVFTQQSATEHLWLLYYDLPQDSWIVNGVHFPIVTSFVLSALAFMPLGQYVGERLEVFRTAGQPLPGYCWDLAGSLCGVVAFSAASFLRLYPPSWFAVILGVGFFAYLGLGRLRWLYAVLAIAVIALVTVTDTAKFYSPYYAISTTSPAPGHLIVQTNGSLHQMALPLARADEMLGDDETIRQGYHYPYRLLGQTPQRGLVLGAGTGNDVAVMLDEGVGQIDAVEIDPVILSLGQQHADRPYASDRVTAHNTDARAFLNDSTQPFDLIVFGTLDSMTRLSALSNVRLDNFVYTVESLRAARAHLSDHGGVALYFMVGTDYIDEHLRGMLTEAFGEPPIVVARQAMLFNRIYLAGPAFDKLRHQASLPPGVTIGGTVSESTPLPHDEWPYLYLQTRNVSDFYLSLIAIFSLVTVVAVAVVSPDLRRSVRRGADLEMALYGLAFLLLESKFVTEMNLVWGATWLTSAVVFASILATVLVATVCMQVRPLPWHAQAIALVVAVLANYFVPVELLAGRSLALRLLLSLIFVGAPIFFAAGTFALAYARRTHAQVAFGWNLIGAVVGGLCEFASMAIGLKALSLVALTAYLLAFAVRRR